MKLPKEVKFIIKTLEENGHEAFVVGGAVRDSLLGIKPLDYDLTTDALPNEIVAIFKRKVDHIYKIGKDFGTISLVIKGKIIEVTTYRIESEYLDYRRPEKVEFSKKLVDDLRRRDFTINALCFNKEYIDLVGGLKDLKKKQIRAIGDPNLRFTEDALRILRAIRFACKLGFEIEEETKKALFENKALLNKIAIERVQEEFNKILVSKNASKYLEEYFEIFTVFIPEIEVFKGYDQSNPHHQDDLLIHSLKVVNLVPNDLVLRLAALFHDLGKPKTRKMDDGIARYLGHARVGADYASLILKRMKYSNQVIKDVLVLIERHMIRLEVANLKRLISKIGLVNTKRLIYLLRADKLSLGRDVSFLDQKLEEVEKLEKEEAIISLKELKIDGNDLIKLGFKGREIGKALDFLFSAYLGNKVENDKEKLIKYLGDAYGQKRKEKKSISEKDW